MMKKVAKKASPVAGPLLDTVEQIEDAHPALRGKLRGWLHRARAGEPEYALLLPAIVKVGRSIFIDRAHLHAFIEANRSPIPSRARVKAREAA